MTRKKQKIEDVKMDLTPMIDVVFLLLIFFICTLKFKVLEGKLPTFLPKDVGVNSSPADVMLEKLEIDIVDKGQTLARNGTTLSMTIVINKVIRVPSLQNLYERVSTMRRADPELKLTLYPQLGINYEEVIKVVDECVRAEITDITFAGVAFDV
jgi:biopolymer transport protein ExbD